MGRPVVSASFANRSLVCSLTLIVVLIRWSLPFSRFVDLLPYRSARRKGFNSFETGRSECRSAYRTTLKASDPPAPLDGSGGAVRCTHLRYPWLGDPDRAQTASAARRLTVSVAEALG
jgi:hypothetical protein